MFIYFNTFLFVDEKSWAISISMSQSMCQSLAKHFIHESLQTTQKVFYKYLFTGIYN